ncbi:hypothetical protein N7510_010354 [Penicillium lagena]|uniref:uncharacterized protein n=1 Tax=Penicillium lagena TaxID=94218 RepID=UPI002541CBFC|nr:uncharacterized protein N7510_010354 [Penicillium lagena]KAJ5605200.1 hypothetical protein N7510_010354 [Penicillium lagena]
MKVLISLTLRTAISTTGPTAAELAEDDYGTNRITLLIAFSLMYQIGQGLGGLVIPPCSELFGRRMPYIISCSLFSLSCLIVGLVPHISAIFVGRFFSGLASAVPSVVISGTVEDQFNSEHRVWIVLFWNAAATAGLAFGPVYASCISGVASCAAICTAFNTVLLLGMRESRPSKLLRKKIASLSEESPGAHLKFHSADPFPDLAAFVDVVFIRPTRMMVTEPILIIVSALSAISWGIVYLFSESITSAYLGLGLPRSSASFPLLALIIGVCIGIFPHIWDTRKMREKKRQNLKIDPEDKTMGFAFGTPALAAGLWWFYGTTPPAMWRAHWLLPTAGLVLVGLGVNEIAYTLSGYLTDTYTVYSASAFAGLAFVRALVSGIMPLIGYVIFDGSQTRLPGFIIAGIATLFCIVPFIFFRLGKALRYKSQFAKYSFEVHMRTQLGEV